MKTTIALVLLAASFTAVAGTTCRTDQFGTTRCTDSSGYSQTWRTDQFGTQRGTDSEGNSATCRTDQFGTTRCN